MGTNGITSVYNSFYNINKNVPLNTSVPVSANNENKEFQDYPVASVSLGDMQQSYQQKPTSTALKWGVGIGTTIVVLGALSLLLTRGGTGRFAKRLTEISKKLDRSIKDKSAKKGALTPLEQGKLLFDKGAKKVVHGLKVIANITPYKDTFFDRIFTNKFSKALKLDKIPDWCRRFSRSLTMRTNTKLARNAINAADDLSAYMSKLSAQDLARRVTINKETKTVGEWLQKAKGLAASIKSSAGDAFGTASRNSRIAQVDADLKSMDFVGTLRAKLYPGVKSKEALTKGGKEALKTVKDGYATENITASLREKAANGLKASCKPTQDSAKELEMILNGLYPEAEAAQHVAQVKKFSKAFNRAAKFEEGVYLRQAELEAGAALTDLGSLALLAGTGVYATATQDSREKRISKALTFGIPVIGTAGLCLFQTSLGLTGILPLAIAITGGKILNMCGSAVSDKYIASANAKKQFMDELAALRLANTKGNNPFTTEKTPT